VDAVQVQDTALDYEILVVDDGSQDATAEVAETHGARVIRQTNAGPAAARNAGARAARGEVLAFTDADCEPSPGWLEALCRPLLDDASLVAVKGAYRTRQRELVARFVQQEYEQKYCRLEQQETIDFVDTYSCAYRRAVFLENGGFDTAFPVPSVEDQELSFRLAAKGYRMVFSPSAIVYHIHDRTLGDYVRRKWGIGYWKVFLLRWLPEKALSDSHTPPSLRAQILLLALALAMAAVGFLWPSAWIVAALALVAFYLTAIPLLGQIAQRDLPVLLIAPSMLLLRAGALGFGLLWGLLFPPKRTHQPKPGLYWHQQVVKRLMDIVGGAIGLLISLPVILIAGVAIKLDSPGPVIFRQQRAGEGGKPFTVYKLRTMYQDAEQRVHEVLKHNPLDGPVYKIPNDPRVTRVGRFLRRWSLDELPQFWNVLKGDMSLVGPRPEELWVVEQYSDHERQRLLVKPGLTGPMQVNGRGKLDMKARLALELDYIQNYSLWKDLLILLRTFHAVWRGEGAY